MRYLLLTLAIASVALGTFVGPGFADPNIPNIAPHRHFIETPGGKLVEVGPRICSDPSLQQAFNQFHINVHGSATSPTTPIETLGPQHGAPGLHNTEGANLTIRLCPPTG